MIALWIIGGLVLNCLIGILIGAAIDDKEQRWLKWMKSCPLGLSFAVSCWPWWLWLWWREMHGGGR